MTQSTSTPRWNLTPPPSELMERCRASTATRGDFAEFYEHCDGMLAEQRRRHRAEFAAMRTGPNWNLDMASMIDEMEDETPPPLPPEPEGRSEDWDDHLERWDSWLDRIDKLSGELARLRSENAVAPLPLTLSRR